MAKKKIKKTTKKIEINIKNKNIEDEKEDSENKVKGKVEDKDKKKDSENKVEGKDEKEDKKTDSKIIEKKHNTQLKWAIILMASVLAIILIFYGWKYIDSNFLYINLEFQKTQLGDLIFYSTRIPVTDKTGNIVDTFAINLRNDPRMLENIPVPEDPIKFRNKKGVYLNIDPNMKSCDQNTVVMIELSGFLREFALYEVRPGISDEEYAEESGFEYVTCKNNPNNTVIQFRSGDKSEIVKTGTYCYDLVYADCEISQVSDRFIIKILEDYMQYFKRVN